MRSRIEERNHYNPPRTKSGRKKQKSANRGKAVEVAVTVEKAGKTILNPTISRDRILEVIEFDKPHTDCP